MLTLKQKIMWRVYGIYLVRRLFAPVMVKCYILVLLLWRGVVHISVADVLANMKTGSVSALYSFSSTAFLNTETSIQIGAIVVLLLGFWFVWDVLPHRLPPWRSRVTT